MSHEIFDTLSKPLILPCGTVLKNRIVKSAMSDSLGDGCGNPTDAQIRLYQRWAEGGVAAMIIGEVQGSPHFAEKPGNLMLGVDSDDTLFTELARTGANSDTQLWLQLGHAGAMAHPPISTPKGPSVIDIPGLSCEALTLEEIQNLSAEVVDEVRNAVGPHFVVAVKLNATDQLAGGLDEKDALAVVSALGKTGIDLIDISGGTYFPGAKSASDRVSSEPYFLNFATRAQKRTNKPLMVTGGFKSLNQAINAVTSGSADLVGLARALVLDPDLPNHWLANQGANPSFPRFASPPQGGITAWYTMRMTHLGQDSEADEIPDLESAVRIYNQRDEERVAAWNDRFRHSE